MVHPITRDVGLGIHLCVKYDFHYSIISLCNRYGILESDFVYQYGNVTLAVLSVPFSDNNILHLLI